MKYVEQELAKKRGRKIDVENDLAKNAEVELYKIPDHLKVSNIFIFIFILLSIFLLYAFPLDASFRFSFFSR